MENLQLVLFVLGAIAIIAVLVHGFWSIRKQQPKSLKESPITGFYKDPASVRDSQGFDVDGIGEVRVKKEIHRAEYAKMSSHHKPTVDLSDNVAVDNHDMILTEGESFDRQEPVLKTDPQIKDDEAQVALGLGQDSQRSMFDAADTEVKEAESETLGEPKDVLVLHVVGNDGQGLSGAELLPCLLSLNFKFGDMDIFHRHADNAGNGKVLFSLANMVKPGVFDLDNMEQFMTEGVVLFMTLPCHGDALMNFSIMLNSAQQMADDVNGRLLDGGRADWSESTKQIYLQRIRAQLD
ncbi:cell division protein ZipA [Shewanella sp. VB17]|uniref:cell division protein ZipA n=1 Tax=Shewanella sp. VB17 TaxID=2739432 RepID=UPI0015650AF7|nr:cell division protein ZipA [Shewanella sp. VB17]NRD74347.1 cell division protein ZipA [Shewanella sp. VB17]